MKTHIQVSEYSKQYKTYENAVKAAEKLVAEMKAQLDFDKVNPRFVVVAVGEKFSPVWVDTSHWTGYFAQKGFMVIAA